MNFDTYLHSSTEQITNSLNSFLKKYFNKKNKKYPLLSRLNTIFSESLTGGKCIRGTLVKLGYELYSKKNNSEILKIAIAYEIIHGALLIKDDVVDKSDLRRGKKTIHQQLGGDHYGVSQAIFMSDLGLYLPINIISQTSFNSVLKKKSIELFSNIVLNTIIGQMLDMELLHINNVKETDILMMYKQKTAYYTISGPLLMGATLANAPPKVLKALQLFGENSGIAFQIKDDILGIFGEVNNIGKSTMTDIAEGKKTLLLSHCLKHASSMEKEFIQNYYGKGIINPQEHAIIINIFKNTGTDKYAGIKAKKYISTARTYISYITSNKEHTKMLNDFLDLIINRKK